MKIVLWQKQNVNGILFLCGKNGIFRVGWLVEVTMPIFRKAVLVYVVENGEVIFAEKLDKVGQGKLNGYGGKPKPGESLVEAACREFWEETGGAALDPRDLKQAAITRFKNAYTDGSSAMWTIYVYIAPGYVGKILATREMGEPERYPINELPLHRLLPADPYWLPQVLSGKQLYVTGSYTPGLAAIEDITVEECTFLLDW